MLFLFHCHVCYSFSPLLLMNGAWQSHLFNSMRCYSSSVKSVKSQNFRTEKMSSTGKYSEVNDNFGGDNCSPCSGIFELLQFM